MTCGDPFGTWENPVINVDLMGFTMVIQWVLNGKPLEVEVLLGKSYIHGDFFIAIFDYQISKPRKGWIL